MKIMIFGLSVNNAKTERKLFVHIDVVGCSLHVLKPFILIYSGPRQTGYTAKSYLQSCTSPRR